MLPVGLGGPLSAHTRRFFHYHGRVRAGILVEIDDSSVMLLAVEILKPCTFCTNQSPITALSPSFLKTRDRLLLSSDGAQSLASWSFARLASSSAFACRALRDCNASVAESNACFVCPSSAWRANSSPSAFAASSCAAQMALPARRACVVLSGSHGADF